MEMPFGNKIDTKRHMTWRVSLHPVRVSVCMLLVYYTQHKKKVNTFSTVIISDTNSIDGKCLISYEREIPPL